ncbi:tapasin-related protein-like [Dipodomys merriami]|uniref:tapasin-related protein-like n=1 Tax=Dipodomys merriami TaxID=94247 RepID=UPI00385573CB
MARGWALRLCLAALSAAAAAGDPAAEPPWRQVDVVFDCFLVTEGGSPGAWAARGPREKASLVLKGVSAPDDGSLEGLTDFQGDPVTPGDPSASFQASVEQVRVPGAAAFVHAECHGQPVGCEIAPYVLGSSPGAPCFIAQVQLPGTGPSLSLLMKALGGAENAVLHPRPGPPQTVKTAVEFLVAAETPSLTLRLGSSGALHCGFSMAPGLQLLSVHWRRQHRGEGQLVYSWAAGQGRAAREGAALDPTRLLAAGDATLTLAGLTLKDEGTYVCQVTTTAYQAQQVIQLSIHAPPRVRVSVAETAAPPTVVCTVSGYYPLHVGVAWTREDVGGAPAPVADASFSSLRQSMAGTYSISSSLRVDAGPAGAIYTCEVTHSSLEEPLRASMRLDPRPESRTGTGTILSAIFFLLVLSCWVLQRQQVFFPRSAKPLRYTA